MNSKATEYILCKIGSPFECIKLCETGKNRVNRRNVFATSHTEGKWSRDARLEKERKMLSHRST